MRWFTLTALVIFLKASFVLHAQTFDAPKLFNNFPNSVGDLQIIDLDQDGDLDIVTQGLRDYTIGWFENDGSGNLSAYQVLQSDAQTGLSMAIADFDGDGDFDIVSALDGSYGAVFLLRNDGSTSFGPAEYFPDLSFLQGVKDIEHLDYDTDGDLDIILVRSFGVKIFENDGTGSFTQAYSKSAGSYIEESVLVDINQDGALDLAFCSTDFSRIYWLENLGGGVFDNVSILSDDVDQPEGLQLADLDGDGDEDILTGSRTDNEISWLENTPTGFAAASVIITVAVESKTLHAADIDNDGMLDIVNIRKGATNNIAWFKNLGGMSFSSANVIGANPHAWILTTGDLDNDGALDVVTSDMTFLLDLPIFPISYANDLNVYYTSSPGNFNPPVTIAEGSSLGNELIDVDIDSDGDTDVIGFSRVNIVWNENVGGGTFSSAKEIFNFPADCIDHADFDGDGHVDFVVGFEESLFYVKNDGSLNFTETLLNVNFRNFQDVVAEDLDGDGDIDILASTISVSAGSIHWVENLGGGTFSSLQEIVYSFPTIKNLQFTDMDNDGLKDIVGYTSNELYVYANLGGPGVNFAARTLIDGGLPTGFADAITIADGDGDGLKDIFIGYAGVAFGTSLPDIVTYKNNGGFSFGPQTVISPDLDRIYSLELLDYDEDGDLDIISAATFSVLPTHFNAIAWHENDGSGNFGARQIITNELRAPGNLKATDLDSDGDTDLLFVAALNAQVGWFENLTINDGCTSPVTDLNYSFSPGSPLDNLTLTWTAIPEATKYRVEVAKVDPLPVINRKFITNTNSLSIDAAIPAGIEIEWSVRAACPGDTTESSSIATINIPVARVATKAFTVFPNPASDQIIFQAESAFDLQVWNSIGQIIFDQKDQQLQQTLDLRNWIDGPYYYRLLLADGSEEYGNFLKQ